MADANSTAAPNEGIRFSPVSQLNKRAHSLDIADTLNAKLSQLTAMLAVTYGCGGPTFREFNDEIQDNYMWACSDLADECRELFSALDQIPDNLPDGKAIAAVPSGKSSTQKGHQ